jgi:RimJ/RimL family protein N-acetyltransferase
LVELRQLLDSDSEAMREIFGDAEVVRFMAVPRLETCEDALGLVRSIHQHRVAGTLFQWGIVKRGDSSVCGTCTLAGIDRINGRAELGFALGRRHWGSGVVREAASLVIEYGFTGMGLHRLEADADPRNVKSLRVLERLGFVREGYQRERHLVAGERQDGILFGLLASEWRTARRDA